MVVGVAQVPSVPRLAPLIVPIPVVISTVTRIVAPSRIVKHGRLR
jgi:hypothetical protein